MCQFTDDCTAGREAYWEGEESATGHKPFGCEECGYSNCL